MAATSSHLQCQCDCEGPKEERHQPEATDEEGSASQALNYQTLGRFTEMIRVVMAKGPRERSVLTLRSWRPSQDTRMC